MNTTQDPTIPALGFGMQGMGPAIERLITSVCERFDVITYLEIGVGEGVTLAAISDMIRRTSKEWRSVGVDLPNGYSLDLKRVAESMWRKNLKNAIGLTEEDEAEWNQVNVFLADSQEFLRDHWDESVCIALIDGCHGKDCAMNDFLNIEKKVLHNGLVMFHDFGHDQTGQPQPHCKNGIDVRGACRELGLLDGKRVGWTYIETIVGDKAAGSGDMGVFRKW